MRIKLFTGFQMEGLLVMVGIIPYLYPWCEHLLRNWWGSGYLEEEYCHSDWLVRSLLEK